MKANEAPEKIFVKITHPISDEYTEMIAFEDGDGVEYTSTDAFIEMAAKWLMENVEKHISADGEYTVYYNEMFEDFKKAMEGE